MTDEVTGTEEETDFESAFSEHAAAKDGVTDAIEPEEELSLDDVDGEDLNLDNNIDIYAGLSDDGKAEVEKLQQANIDLTHRINSDAGRVSAFQRKVNGLEQEIQTIREGGTAGQPDPNQIADAMSGSDDEWVQFTEDYPDVAKAIDNRLGKAGQATQESIDSTLAPIKEQHQRTIVNEAEATANNAVEAVTNVFPQWKEAINSNEYKVWLDTQPPGIQALQESHDTADAISLIEMFDNNLVANGQPTLKATPNNGVEALEVKDKADELKAKRERQLQDGTTVTSKSAGVDPGGESVNEFEKAFAYHAKKKEAQRRA